MAQAARSARGHDEAHGRFALSGDDRIGRIEKDVKAVDAAGMPGQAAVAKVEAQEVRILEVDQLGEWMPQVSAAKTGASARPVDAKSGGAAIEPSAYGAAGDAGDPGDFALVVFVREGKDPVELRWRPHAGDGPFDTAGGIRTHTSLRTGPFEDPESTVPPPPLVLIILEPTLRSAPVANARKLRFDCDFLRSRHRLLTSRSYAGNGAPSSGVAPAP